FAHPVPLYLSLSPRRRASDLARCRTVTAIAWPGRSAAFVDARPASLVEGQDIVPLGVRPFHPRRPHRHPWHGDPDRLGPLLQHRSEEHTSELQSRENLVCRLL